jgi:hypothetical protein
MPTPYGNNFSATAAIEMAGKCHTLNIGDSQSTPTLDYLWQDAWLRALPLRYHYFCISGANTGQVAGNNFGFAHGNASTVDAALSASATSPGYVHSVGITSNSAANPTVVTCSANHGLVTGDTVTIANQSGTVSINGSRVVTVISATTFSVPVNCLAGGGTSGTVSLTITSYGMGAARINRYVSDIAAGTSIATNGMVLTRQLSPASHANSSRGAPWPTFPANSSQPWFHGSHTKGKMVVWKDSATLDKFALYMLKQGTSSSDSGFASRVQADVSAGSTGPNATGWTAALADDGDYDTGTAGILNDHECAIRLYSSSAVYDETGKTLIPLSGIFARCDSGGTIPWNSDNSGCGFDSVGRAGGGVSTWLVQMTQAHWQAYFTATVQVPDACTKIRIMLGHNLDQSGIDVGDGDGSQVEQSGTPALTTSYWKKRYKALIERLRAAYVAAFPSGKVCFELIIPWRSVQTSSMTDATTAADVNRVIKEIAEETGSSWFSFYDYWNGVAPFWALHAWQPANGTKLADALRDGMDRATNYQFAEGGVVDSSGPRNRNWR